MTVAATGRSLIDGIQMGDVTIQVDPGPSAGVLVAKFAFVNVATGQRFGAGYKNANWSDATRGKLAALLESMEQDACLDVFDQGATSSGGEITGDGTTDSVPGF